MKKFILTNTIILLISVTLGTGIFFLTFKVPDIGSNTTTLNKNYVASILDDSCAKADSVLEEKKAADEEMLAEEKKREEAEQKKQESDSNAQQLQTTESSTEPTESENTVTIASTNLDLDRLCDVIANHYNQLNNTDTFVAFAGECYEEDGSYVFTLRSTAFSSANVFCGLIYIDIATGTASDEGGNIWNIFSEY